MQRNPGSCLQSLQLSSIWSFHRAARASTVHVAVSLSHKPKKAHRKLHGSQKVKKMQRALLFYTYFEVRFIMLAENPLWKDFQGKAAHLWWLWVWACGPHYSRLVNYRWFSASVKKQSCCMNYRCSAVLWKQYKARRCREERSFWRMLQPWKTEKRCSSIRFLTMSWWEHLKIPVQARIPWAAFRFGHRPLLQLKMHTENTQVPGASSKIQSYWPG